MKNLLVWGTSFSTRGMSQLMYTSLHSVCVRILQYRYIYFYMLKRIPFVTLNNCKAQNYTAEVFEVRNGFRFGMQSDVTSVLVTGLIVSATENSRIKLWTSWFLVRVAKRWMRVWPIERPSCGQRWPDWTQYCLPQVRGSACSKGKQKKLSGGFQSVWNISDQV